MDTHQVQHSLLDGVGFRLLEPLVHGQEAGPAGDVVDEDDALRAAVEAC